MEQNSFMNEVMQKNTHDYSFKVIVLGDSGVGKTNLILRFSEEDFKNNYVATIGVDFKVRTILADDKRIKLQLWDTAGQQRFRTITETYYKGANGIVLAYSITDRSSFDNINRWMKQIKEKTPAHIKKIIVGNKSDLAQERLVSTLQGKQLAQKLSDEECTVGFLEVSAKTGENVELAFKKISEEIKQYVETHQTSLIKKSTVIRIEPHDAKSKQKSCYC